MSEHKPDLVGLLRAVGETTADDFPNITIESWMRQAADRIEGLESQMPAVPVSRLRELLHVVAELDEGKVLYQQIGGEKIAALIAEYGE